MVRMSNVMTWWYYMAAVWWNFNRYACGLVPFNQTCLLVHWKSQRKATRVMPSSDMPNNTVKLYQVRLLHCQYNIHPYWCSAPPCRELLCHCSCNIYACWPSVTDTDTAAVQTCILVECCCKSAAVRWMLAGSLPLNQHACQHFATHLLRICWRCASLSAISAGMVSHYQPCLLVWCLTMGNAFWCGAISCACWY